MRLIDVDAIKKIDYSGLAYIAPSDYKGISKYFYEQLIVNQPTAYDVDKVVERLELENKRLKTLKNNCIALCDHEVIGIENKAYDYAIKIVRNCGQKN